MKVLLIEPPFQRFMGFKCDWFPLGLGYIASVLNANGFRAKIYNAEFHTKPQYLQYSKLLNRSQSYLEGLENKNHSVWIEIRKVINSIRPDVVGITVKTVKLKAALRVAEICKSISNNIIVVTGGPHCTVLPENMEANENVDYVIRGEGDLAMLELLEALKGEKTLENIGGLSYKKGTKIFHNKNRPLIDDLNTIPFPSPDCLINAPAYDSEAFGNIITSRGCPFNCAYCAAHLTWTKKVRYRSIENILEQIRLTMNTYGTRQFTFWDDSFTVNKKRFIRFCEALAENRLKINWSCNTRVDLLDEEILGYMKKAGCNNVELGIESGSTRILKLIKKDIAVEKMQKVAHLLRKYKLYWSGFFMLGLPSETADDIKMTVELMKKLRPNYATLSIFTPYPGTEFYDILLKQNAITKDAEWHLYNHQSKNNNFTGIISNEDFGKIVDDVSKVFDSNNNSIGNILSKASSKATVYFYHPTEFLKDAKRYFNYVGLLQRG